MLILDVLIEYAASSLNRPFSYAYNGEVNVKKGIRVVVPFAGKKIIGYVVDVKTTILNIDEYQKEYGYDIKEIDSLVDYEPLFNDELNELAKEVASYYFAPLISVYQTMLPPSLKPKISSMSKPKIAYDYFYVPKSANEEGLTSKQIELLRLINREKIVSKKDVSRSIAEKLLEKELIEVVKKEKIRLIQEEVKMEEDKLLSEEQKNAFETIISSDGKTFLLEGVTGSGKTEVYLQVSKSIINQGKTVLMLVPEISLTVQMVRRFKSRFDNIAILHSALTPAEKYDEYRRIINGEVSIVVGARSAIFAPLSNIGLIIIDEEHVETYKQDVTPCYNAITVAFMRQKMFDCKIILGSATPSFESRIRAMAGKYIHLKLSKRINKSILPKTEIINMGDYRNIDKKSVLISLKLRQEIELNLQRKEQTILLINRRGYSPSVTCKKCNKVVKCPSCETSLTYHYEDNMLKCHHCGYVEVMYEECPRCGGKQFYKLGFGSEKIEKEINSLFPTARVLRLDSDIAQVRGKVGNVLTSFENEEADILIGTQIVAKGHDFRNVTLVGVVLADLGLNIPSFRANERTFALLTQAIGRCGRANKQGRAIIQTYMPQNFVIYDSSLQDYDRFFNEEMANRKIRQYPPYVYCTLVTISSPNEEVVIDVSANIKQFFEVSFANKKVSVIGPSEPFITKFDKQFRRKILLKYKDYQDIKEVINELLLVTNKNHKIKVAIDVDPYNDF